MAFNWWQEVHKGKQTKQSNLYVTEREQDEVLRNSCKRGGDEFDEVCTRVFKCFGRLREVFDPRNSSGLEPKEADTCRSNTANVHAWFFL